MRDVVVVGASAGGVEALRRLASRLPAQFPASVCLVLHIGQQDSQLPRMLGAWGPNPASHARDGDRLVPGRLLLAPPDRHLLIDGDRLRLTRGPKEHHTRPAIDPLFRSAALSAGPRVIGVVLTGCLDDGSAGLQAIRDCGGLTVVQDPDDAAEPSMPRAALRALGRPDHLVRLDDLPDLLARLVCEPAPPQREQPGAWEQEQRASLPGPQALQALQSAGRPTPLVCPECRGTLYEIHRSRPPRFRCHTGHAYSLHSLGSAQHQSTEDALFAAMRALQDKAEVLRRLAELDRLAGDPARAEACDAEAERVLQQAEALRALSEAQRPIPLDDAGTG
ncbi:chemotaxis protein CheB [Aquabacterium sp. J223]|uniref:chemotaxis protein CheB n=1 Tax=Aquabacterium sp. J223 TaxID=2898431 RepID=UPI0021ADED8A|nr:chemotaxis protein CheB [Aquabacterium sp. J223]UUX95052.1 chemotaxis protein CheB [Aquabacterium sp. J223]